MNTWIWFNIFLFTKKTSDNSTDDSCKEGSLEPRMDVCQEPEDDSVLCHGEDDSRKRKHGAEKGGGQPQQCTYRNDPPVHRDENFALESMDQTKTLWAENKYSE